MDSLGECDICVVQNNNYPKQSKKAPKKYRIVAEDWIIESLLEYKQQTSGSGHSTTPSEGPSATAPAEKSDAKSNNNNNNSDMVIDNDSSSATTNEKETLASTSATSTTPSSPPTKENKEPEPEPETK